MTTAVLPTPAAGPRPVSDDEPLYELVDGMRVELPMSAVNVLLANELSQEIGAFARPKNLGRAVVEILFELPLVGRSRIRRPDAAFVSYQRWPRDKPLPAQGNAWAVVPELAVEFVSPTDNADELTDKLFDYLDAGVKCVWIVYTRHRYVIVFDSRTHLRGYTEGEELDGKDFLPNFRIPVASLFQPRA